MKLRLSTITDHSKKADQLLLLFLVLCLFLTSCTGSQPKNTNRVTIQVDGIQKVVDVSSGITVQEALNQSGVKIETLDRIQPQSDSIINEPISIQVKRIREEFKIEEKVIPFPQQTLKNESLPEKQLIIVQKGVNGKQQITIRYLIEDNIEISHNVTKTVSITEAIPEIIMVGVQAPFISVSITGRLVFISGNNAWKMEGS